MFTEITKFEWFRGGSLTTWKSKEHAFQFPQTLAMSFEAFKTVSQLNQLISILSFGLSNAASCQIPGLQDLKSTMWTN